LLSAEEKPISVREGRSQQKGVSAKGYLDSEKKLGLGEENSLTEKTIARKEEPEESFFFFFSLHFLCPFE